MISSAAWQAAVCHCRVLCYRYIVCPPLLGCMVIITGFVWVIITGLYGHHYWAVDESPRCAWSSSQGCGWVTCSASSYHIWTRLRVIVCKLGYAVCNNKGQAGDGPGACSCLPCQRLIVIHPDGLEGSIVEAVCTPAARIVRTNKCSNNSDNGNNSRDDTNDDDDDDDDDSNAFQLILSLVRAGQVLSLQGSLSYASL